LPRLYSLLARLRTSSSGLVSPPELRGCESDSLGTERGRIPQKGRCGHTPLHRESKRGRSDPASIVPGRRSRPSWAGTRSRRSSTASSARLISDRQDRSNRANRPDRAGRPLAPRIMLPRPEPVRRPRRTRRRCSPSPSASRGYARAFCLITSNSACVIAPSSSSFFALWISSAAPPPAVSRTYSSSCAR
jgi:hypothetical protein